MLPRRTDKQADGSPINEPMNKKHRRDRWEMERWEEGGDITESVVVDVVLDGSRGHIALEAL